MRLKTTKNFNTIESQTFFEYFKSHLRAENGMILGNGNMLSRWNDKDQLETVISDFLKYKKDRILMDWVIVQNYDGSIPYIEAILKSKSISKQKFNTLIRKQIDDVSAKARGRKVKKYAYRLDFGFINGSNVVGEYWLPNIDKTFKDFRISPSFPDDRISMMANTEQIISMDIELLSIDYTHGYEIAHELTNRFSAILSFILDVGIYPHVIEQRYFAYTDDSAGIKTIWKKGFLNIQDPRREQFKKMLKRNKANLGLYKGDLTNHLYYHRNYLTFPESTTKILSYFQTCDPTIKKAFERACQLYQLALVLGKYYPTVKCSYLHAAVDAIAHSMHKEYGGKFKIFMTKHCPGIDPKLLDFIHGDIRSAHWHAGKFALGEKEYKWDTLVNYNYNYNDYMKKQTHKVIREAISNWIMTLIEN